MSRRRVTALPRGEGGAAEAKPRAPLRFGDDPLLWAAWLYYEDELTQSEIATVMGISRPTVIAYLAEARERGIVNISINGDRFRALSLARQLSAHFGLKDCLVIPAEGGAASLIERLGRAGAQALGWHLRAGDMIGIGWGRTMLAVAEAAGAPGLSDLTVMPATGAMTADLSCAPELCATRLAQNLSARMIPVSAPAILSDPGMRDGLLQEPVLAAQLSNLTRLDMVLLGLSPLRPGSTVEASGFLTTPEENRDSYRYAVGAIAGRFYDAAGKAVPGSLDSRTIGIDLPGLLRVPTRIGVCGGFDKVQALLGALRGELVNVLVTDSATAEGILRADGIEVQRQSLTRRPPTLPGRDRDEPPAMAGMQPVKKILNDPRDAVNEAIEGMLLAFPQYLRPIGGSLRSLARTYPAPAGKVGLVVGGGAGHEPMFLGYVGPGLADAAAIGNVFSSPPPDRILDCTRQADGGAGVLHVFGNYTGDTMNFEMAAEMAVAEGITVRSVITTDDVASSPASDRAARRGTAGNAFVFKIAGAVCDRMQSLDECERIARKANAHTYSMGAGLSACSLPETGRPSFLLGPDEIELGVGIHGEPGVMRADLMTADGIADRIIETLIEDASLDAGARIALLLNTLGSTPMMELAIVNRRIHKRLAARKIEVMQSWLGDYCTSLDMAGLSVSMLVLDEELQDLLQHPCDSIALTLCQDV